MPITPTCILEDTPGIASYNDSGKVLGGSLFLLFSIFPTGGLSLSTKTTSSSQLTLSKT